MRGRNQFSDVSPLERLNSLITVDNSSGCWNYSGRKDKNGYGIFAAKSLTASRRAHRISWIIYNGKIPKGMCVCHKCDNPTCVNPDHLFLGTIKDNNNDKMIKGRTPKGTSHAHHGTNHPSSKVNEEQVKYIRNEYNRGKSVAEISKEMELRPVHVWKITHWVTWKWLT